MNIRIVKAAILHLIVAYISPATALRLSAPRPGIAVCVTGDVRRSFIATASNFREVLVDRLSSVGSVDVFFHVKRKVPAPDLGDTLTSISPLHTHIYSGEEPETPALQGHRYRSLMVQRFQWQRCWELLLEEEARRGAPYDFVVRTRPDLLYSPLQFKPQEWALWSDSNSSEANGFCKCHRPDLIQAGAKYPVFDVFFVGPRRVARVFMTTWSRRSEYLKKKKWKDCWMYHDHRDAFECLTIKDLSEHGYGLSVIPEIPWRPANASEPSMINGSEGEHRTMNSASRSELPSTIHAPGNETCRIGFNGVWQLFFHLSLDVKSCFYQSVNLTYVDDNSTGVPAAQLETEQPEDD